MTPFCRISTKSLSIISVGQSAVGVVPTIVAGGTLVSYQPPADFNGIDTFTYVINDGTPGSDATATVSVTVTEVNDPPTASNDSLSTTEEVPLTFNSAILLANDSAGPANELNQTLVVTQVGSATNGAVDLVNGLITFTPDPDFFGEATFVYTIEDNGTTNGVADPLSATATVTIDVEPDPGFCLPLMDFDDDGFGDPLSSGTILTDQWSAWGVTVTTDDPIRHPAMIFSSSNPSGGDTDLGTPNEDFNGPGVGLGGGQGAAGENSVDLSNIVVISEDADPSDPDDEAKGGTLIFSFDMPVELASVGLLDIEEGSGHVKTFDENGNLISTIAIPALGNNSRQSLAIGDTEVSRLEITLTGSGGLTDLVFCSSSGSTHTASISGATTIDEGSDYQLNLSTTSTITSQWAIDWGSGPVEIVAGDASSITHFFADGLEEYSVRAVALTDGSAIYTNSLDLDVNNVAPTLTIGGEAEADPGQTYTLSLASADPGDDTITHWTIDWGDGQAAQVIVGNPDSVDHVFTSTGTYNITAHAYDEDNPYSAGLAEQAGLVVVEAENYTGAASGTGSAANHTWDSANDGSTSGGTYVTASPNSGVSTGDSLHGPRLDYDVEFSTTGSYYVWVLMKGDGDSNDSVHFGLDGQVATFGRHGMTDRNSGSWHWEEEVDGRKKRGASRCRHRIRGHSHIEPLDARGRSEGRQDSVDDRFEFRSDGNRPKRDAVDRGQRVPLQSAYGDCRRWPGYYVHGPSRTDG